MTTKSTVLLDDLENDPTNVIDIDLAHVVNHTDLTIHLGQAQNAGIIGNLVTTH